MIVAVDDAFVVPIPALMKATGFFKPGIIDAIAPELRENLSRRLANATTGWNVIATGSGGRPGLMLGAHTEQAAIDGAVAACGQQDRECRVIAVGPFLVERLPSTAEAKEPGQTPPVGQKPPETLLPEAVPLISDRNRATIKGMYLSASDHKAIAISSNRAAIITGQKDEETAKSAAVDACRRGTNQSGMAIPCELYAIGNVVVSKRGNPPMPPQPWIARNPSIETQFVVSDVPVTSAARGRIESGYAKGGKPKALAISADGSHDYAYWNADNPEEAARRALEACGTTSGFPCMIVAIDDVFVVPIPKSRKVIGFFRPDVIASEFRDEAVRRLGVTTSGWNAIAIGAGGQPGLGLAAATEQAAVEGALANCGRNVRECRVIAIGPFLVESESPPNAPVSSVPTTAPSAPQ